MIDWRRAYALDKLLILLGCDGKWLPARSWAHAAVATTPLEDLIDDVKRGKHAAGTEVWNVVDETEERSLARFVVAVEFVAHPLSNSRGGFRVHGRNFRAARSNI